MLYNVYTLKIVLFININQQGKEVYMLDKKFSKILSNFFKKHFEHPIPSFSDETTLINDLGFDSLDMVEFIGDLSISFEVSLNIEICAKPTIGQLKEMIKGALKEKTLKEESLNWVVPISAFNPVIGDALEITELIVAYCKRKNLPLPEKYNATTSLKEGFNLPMRRIKGFLWYLKCRYRIFIPFKKLASKHSQLTIEALGSYISQKLSSKIRNNANSDPIVWPEIA